MHPEAGDWKLCSDKVMLEFMPDVMRNYHQLLVPLLENGVKVSSGNPVANDLLGLAEIFFFS